MKNVSILINSLAAGGVAEKQCFYISDNVPIKNIYLLNNINAYKSLNDKITLLLNKKRSRFQQLIIGIYSLSNKVNNDDTIISFMELSNFINIIVRIL